MAAWVLWKGLLDGSTGCYTQQLGEAVNLFPYLDGALEWAPWPILLIGWGLKSGTTTN